MTVYGFNLCTNCVGTGLILTLTEKSLITRGLLQHGPCTVDIDNIKRCTICLGTGWVLKANMPHNVILHNKK